MHHDESLHATFRVVTSPRAAATSTNPLMHGPAPVSTRSRGVFKLAGGRRRHPRACRSPSPGRGAGGDARCSSAARSARSQRTVAAGAARGGRRCCSTSRASRANDVIAVLWTVLIVARRVGATATTARSRWLVLAAAALALGFRDEGDRVHHARQRAPLPRRHAHGGPRSSTRQARVDPRRVAMAVVLFPGRVGRRGAVGDPLAPLRARAGASGSARARADMLVVLGDAGRSRSWSAASQIVPRRRGGRLASSAPRTGWTVAVLVGRWGRAGPSWSGWRGDAQRWWAPRADRAGHHAAAVHNVVSRPPQGFPGRVSGGSSTTGWDQQDVRRGKPGRGFYYLMMLPALRVSWCSSPRSPAARGLLRRGDRLARLLAWWFRLDAGRAGRFAGEKMPWLKRPTSPVPLALLAGPRRRRGPSPPLWRRLRDEGRGRRLTWGRDRRGCGPAARARRPCSRCAPPSGCPYAHPDTPVEPLIYTQDRPPTSRASPVRSRRTWRPAPTPHHDRRRDDLGADVGRGPGTCANLPRRPLRAGGKPCARGGYGEDAIVIVGAPRTLPHGGPRCASASRTGGRTCTAGGFPEGRLPRHGRFEGPRRRAGVGARLWADWADFHRGRHPRGVRSARLRGEVLFPP